jgi:hypothetical protein
LAINVLIFRIEGSLLRGVEVSSRALSLRKKLRERENLGDPNLKMKLFMLFVAIAMAVFAVSPLYADTAISIQDASFETYNPLTTSCGTGCAFNHGPIPGWAGTGGSWEPNSTYFSTPPPDGTIVAYTSGGTISQDLGITLLSNSTYTLAVFVGNRLDGDSGTYSIALDAGGTMLDSLSGDSHSILAGTFADEILIFSTGSTVTPGDLSIVLSNPLGGQADFDNVSLSVAPNTAVPEPESLVLLVVGGAFVGLFSLLRRA